MRRRVPRHQRLPHVVVGGVPVLVVRRVEIGEVEVAEAGRGRAGIAVHRVARPGEERRQPQVQRLLRARRPLLDVRHLHPGGRVDPVGGLDEARQQERFVRMTAPRPIDLVADGIDARRVVRLHEAGLTGEDVGHIAGLGRQPVQAADDSCELVVVDERRVGRDVAARERCRVAGAVDRGDLDAPRLECLRDARRSGEEVDRRARAGGVRNRSQRGHEPTLRPQVLDHRRERYVRPPRQRRTRGPLAAPNVTSPCASWSRR